MSKDDAGVWSATVGPVDPEIYQYNFVVDGVRILDPGNPNLKNGRATRRQHRGGPRQSRRASTSYKQFLTARCTSAPISPRH